MFKINLVPEVQQKKQKEAKRNTYASISGIILLSLTVVSLLIMGSIKVAQNIRLANTKEAIKKVEEDSVQYRALEESVLSLEAGLSGVKQILNGQNSWIKLFPHIENATPKDVQYTNLDIKGNSVTAQLRGRSIDSLARFIDSYKTYQVIKLSGQGQPGQTVSVSIDNNEPQTVSVNGDGLWVYSIVIDPSTDHQIIISKDNSDEISISYLSETKTINSHNEAVKAEVVNLFTNVNTTQYSKEGSEVTFDATFNFNSEALW